MTSPPPALVPCPRRLAPALPFWFSTLATDRSSFLHLLPKEIFSIVEEHVLNNEAEVPFGWEVRALARETLDLFRSICLVVCALVCVCISVYVRVYCVFGVGPVCVCVKEMFLCERSLT